MIDFFTQPEGFHFLRPLWLLALLPAFVLTLCLWRQSRQARQWRHLIHPDLLSHLVEPGHRHARRSLLWGLLLAWGIGVVAMAGPTWEKRPVPVVKTGDALVILLDLSPSMLAEDLKPSRLTRARLKIADVLRARNEGFTGLIAYAGDAHVVSPLTDDTATIRSLLNALHPNIMPASGSRPEAAVEAAVELFSEAGVSEGQILLITDGVVDQAINPILNRLENTGLRLSVLGIGTPQGAPIPDERGGFERDRAGNIVVAKLEEDRLERLAGRTGGRYERIDASADDVDWLLETPRPGSDSQRQVDREFDDWFDRGPWLVLLLLPAVLYSFRRGLLAVLFALPLLTVLIPSPAHADDRWLAPWLTPNQRGERALSDGDPETAAQQFENPEWRGSALYKAEAYEAAAKAFEQSDTARAHYNRGNALARAGDLEGAIEAYDQALARQPDMSDAQANKALVEQLKQQQEEQQKEQQQNPQSSDDQNGGDSSEDQQQDSEQGEGEQNQNSQDQDSQNPDNAQDGQSNSRNDGQDDAPQDPNTDSPTPQSDADDPANTQGEQPTAGDPAEPQEGEPEDTIAPLQEGDVSDEERQAMEQWLRQVPDDPGGLLRRKFEYQSQQRRLREMRGELEGQGTEERW
ncbi:VWA domain-containing protein [Marinimicrobium sp. ARAG 43.8]|uniref:VWA domain-containing protein n=1 Tax=Marinimicrobium sp. ARAG 43.8 TaxID=3418719 RepID=UPI003CE86120